MAQTGQPAPLQGKSLACDARTWGAAFRGWAGPPSWHPWLLKWGLAVGEGGPALKAGEVPRETGSETRPPRCYWGCRERQARAPCLGPRPTTRAGFPGQEQRRPLLQADKQASVGLAERLPCCSLPFPPQGTLSLLFLGPPGCRSRSGGQVERRSGTPESWALGLGERAPASATPSPPLSEPEPSGRDLGGGWEGTAPGKEEGAIPGLTGPEVSLFFPVARHR